MRFRKSASTTAQLEIKIQDTTIKTVNEPRYTLTASTFRVARFTVLPYDVHCHFLHLRS